MEERVRIKRISNFPTRRYGVFVDGNRVGRSHLRWSDANRLRKSVIELIESGATLSQKDE